MNDAYKTEIFEQHGNTYKIEWFYDSYYGAPWEEHDGHGIVSEWTTRAKRPGELVLNTDGRSRRYYDFQHTVKIAKRDGWNSCRTKAEAAEAAMRDFQYLKDWCDDKWHWCGIVVTLLDEGEETDISAGCWGIEDEGLCSAGHHASIIQDLIGDCEYEANRKVYPVTECGV